MSGSAFAKPEGLHCEVMVPIKGTQLKSNCPYPAGFIYGPECEAETGKLMYLCDQHGAQIRDWKAVHANDPVECKTHGRIGPVKSYLILKAI